MTGCLQQLQRSLQLQPAPVDHEDRCGCQPCQLVQRSLGRSSPDQRNFRPVPLSKQEAHHVIV